MSNGEITRKTFVGRKDEMVVIEDAILNKVSLQIINIQGAGGIGKTSILREVQTRYVKHKDFLITDIIDFFDISTHTWLGFLDQVVSSLHINNNQFEQYEKAKERSEEIEFAGITGSTLKEEQEKILESFKNCYNNLAANKEKIIILIDTFEVVQDIMGEWIADKWLSELRNTTIIIAGRRNKEWQKIVTDKLGSKTVKYLELTEFESEDTKALFAISEAGKIVSDEEREKLQILSGGRPILLTLALDWRWRKEVPPESLTSTSNQYTLEELKSMAPENLKNVQEQFSIELIQRFKTMKPHDQAITYMAIAYKYFSIDTLAYLIEIDKKEAKSLLDEIVDWTFMKYDESTDTYQLHDLVRDLIIEYIWKEIDPTEEERKHIYKELVKFYDDLFSQMDKTTEHWQSKRKKARTTGDKNECLKELLSLKRHKQHHRAHQVFYFINVDYEEGLKFYRSLSLYNLWVRESNANKLLNYERDNALKKINKFYPRYEEELMEAKIKILINRDYDDGLKILDSLSTNYGQQKEAPYFYPDILLYKGIANTFKGEHKIAEKLLQEAIAIFKGFEVNLKETDAEKNLDARIVYRSLARCYGNIALGFMMSGHYSKAIDNYKQAIPYSKKGLIESERAFFLNDLGFLYARLGEFNRGREFWEKGFKLREELLFDYPLALSYNTIGMIEYLADKPRAGRSHCEEAMKIFRRIGDQRGIGLSCRALGGILVRIGDLENSLELLSDAEKYLSEAEAIFKNGGIAPNPTHLAETKMRQGLLYGAYRSIAQVKDGDKDEILNYHKKSEDAFKDCIKGFERVNSLMHIIIARGALCCLYLEVDNYEKADIELKRMIKILSSHLPKGFFRSDSKISLPEIISKHKDLTYPLGILEDRKARIAFARYLNNIGDSNYLKESARHFTLACAYLETYSPEAFSTRNALKKVAEMIEQLNTVHKRREFKNEVEMTQRAYGLENFPEILKRIDDAEIM